jgi:phospho-N-acetylmuramoyl-pentapeptide-transferase
MHGVYVPFLGYWNLGIWFIPFFVMVLLGTFSSRVIDGIDGLAGGVMTIAFGTYGVIAYIQNQIDIAALCFLIAGAILSFLWFNVPPAKYYLGETGMLGLTLTLAVVAFLTDQVFILLVVGCMLVLTSFSSFAQIISKKYFGKKIFRIAPIHWHFHALGWSREGIVMRYWIITLMLAVLSVVIVLIG